ncbi:MAG: hypothetical protein MHM6MM_007105 [Cercozoa sp. M6MM]
MIDLSSQFTSLLFCWRSLTISTLISVLSEPLFRKPHKTTYTQAGTQWHLNTMSVTTERQTDVAKGTHLSCTGDSSARDMTESVKTSSSPPCSAPSQRRRPRLRLVRRSSSVSPPVPPMPALTGTSPRKDELLRRHVREVLEAPRRLVAKKQRAVPQARAASVLPRRRSREPALDVRDPRFRRALRSFVDPRSRNSMPSPGRSAALSATKRLRRARPDAATSTLADRLSAEMGAQYSRIEWVSCRSLPSRRVPFAEGHAVLCAKHLECHDSVLDDAFASLVWAATPREVEARWKQLFCVASTPTLTDSDGEQPSGSSSSVRRTLFE